MSKRVKVLCLHGYRQNAAALREKMGGIRKAFKKVDWHYIDAPHLSAPRESDAKTDPNERSWFNNVNGNAYKYNSTGSPNGYSQAASIIADIIQEEGPFDILLGFSQGATMASLFLANSAPAYPVRAVVLVSGFPTLTDELLFAKDNIDLPSLHIFSKNDTVIPDSASSELMSRFPKPEVVIHEGGHGFPSLSLLKPYLKVLIDNVSE